MQIGKLGLELDMIMGGAGDVARAAGARADRLDRLMHGGAHGRVLAHAEIVVGAPHRHVAGALAGELIGGRVSPAAALQLGKDPVAAFLVQRLKALVKAIFVIHGPASHVLAGRPEIPQITGASCVALRHRCFAYSELHVEMILVIMVTRKLGRRRPWHFGDHGFRRDEEAGDRGRALKGRAHDLGGVDNPPRDQIAELASLRIEAEAIVVGVENLGDDDRAVCSGIGGNLPGGPGDRLPDDGDAGLLIVILGLEIAGELACPQQGDAAARQDAFFDRRARRMHGILNAILLFPDLDFGRAAHPDHGDAAGQARQPFLQLLAVVV